MKIDLVILADKVKLGISQFDLCVLFETQGCRLSTFCCFADDTYAPTLGFWKGLNLWLYKSVKYTAVKFYLNLTNYTIGHLDKT